jgi:GNAT superfamily N-acetyltransferase
MPTPSPAGQHLRSLPLDVRLRDGSCARLRVATPDDRDAVTAFIRSLSEPSRYRRFCGIVTDAFIKAEVARELAYGPERATTLLATREDGRIIGHAVYVVGDQPDLAEVAFAIADDVQGRGLATILLGHLADIASSRGIRWFEADVLAMNRAMLDVFHDAGFPVRHGRAAGTVHLTFPTVLTPATVGLYDLRERGLLDRDERGDKRR